MDELEPKHTQEGIAVCGEYLQNGHAWVRVVGRAKQDRWTGPEGQSRSKASNAAEHVDFKPQLKGKDGDPDLAAFARETGRPPSAGASNH